MSSPTPAHVSPLPCRGATLGRYDGRIARCNGDGTVDVAYDDGDYEESVNPQYVRARVRGDARLGSGLCGPR